MSALERAIEILGSQAKLAAAMGGSIKQAHVSYWLVQAEGRVPPERCAAIESATEGKVTRHDLRPDVFGPTAQAAA